jgi:hypothetical protein
MICFGHGTIDWSAVGAVGTLLASGIALLASWLALKAPEWNKSADRSESTNEVIKATEEALELYAQARQMVAANGNWASPTVITLRTRADHVYQTLDRLVGRPSLTDGAIAVGAGGMSIMAILRRLDTTEEIRQARLSRASANSPERIGAMFVDATAPARQSIEATQEIVKVVLERMDRVRKYAKIT